MECYQNKPWWNRCILDVTRVCNISLRSKQAIIISRGRNGFNKAQLTCVSRVQELCDCGARDTSVKTRFTGDTLNTPSPSHSFLTFSETLSHKIEHRRSLIIIWFSFLTLHWNHYTLCYILPICNGIFWDHLAILFTGHQSNRLSCKRRSWIIIKRFDYTTEVDDK